MKEKSRDMVEKRRVGGEDFNRATNSVGYWKDLDQNSNRRYRRHLKHMTL